MSTQWNDAKTRADRLHRLGVTSTGGPLKRTGPHFLVTPAIMHPLRFEPIIKRLIWGGNRLGSVLRKPIGEGSQYAESWELSDHRSDVSVVAEGPLEGLTLRELVHTRAHEVLGPALGKLDQFPLLVKYIDAEEVLSVQVHPNNELGRRLADDNGKTETWVVIAAEPDSVIYAGLKEGVSRDQFAAAIERGEVEELLHKIPARVGDCILIPAGIVHAIGSGVMIAEIQQMSDATFRVFDWNRVGTDGKPRQLHIAQALESTDFDAGPVNPIVTTRERIEGGERERLSHTEFFSLTRYHLDGATHVGREDRFTILMAVEGDVEVSTVDYSQTLLLGETMLLPAAVGVCEVTPINGPATIITCVVP